jgi:hypothetical protein
MARATLEFVVVDHAEVPEGGNGRGQLSAASLALLEGKTIFMDGRNRSARFSRMANTRGFRVRTRTGERKGSKGTYVWLEPLDNEASAPASDT